MSPGHHVVLEPSVSKSSSSNIAAIGRLTACNRRALHTKAWLNDRHKDVANQLLRVVHPSEDGLQDTILHENRAFTVPTSEYVQIMHVNNNHWVAVTNIGEDEMSTVRVYDS